jgi:predicted RNA-binding Zn-ribbon protein involved in translation (DUF1610 family)
MKYIYVLAAGDRFDVQELDMAQTALQHEKIVGVGRATWKEAVEDRAALRGMCPACRHVHQIDELEQHRKGNSYTCAACGVTFLALKDDGTY